MDRMLLLWNGRLAEISINSVRMEQYIVFCWQEGGRTDGQRVVLEKVASHNYELIRTWEVENIC